LDQSMGGCGRTFGSSVEIQYQGQEEHEIGT
jgi:hypothetical protein